MFISISAQATPPDCKKLTLRMRCAYYAAMNHSEPVRFYRGEVSLGFAK